MITTVRHKKPSPLQSFLQRFPLPALFFVFLALLFVILTYASATSHIVHNTLRVHSYSSLVFSVLTMIAVIPLFCFVVDAVLISENDFQLRLVLLITVLMTCVSLVSVTKSVLGSQYDGKTADLVHRIIMLTTAVLGVLLMIGFLITSIPVSRGFGWKMFKRVGTRPDQIKRFKIFLWWDTLARGDIILVTIVLALSIAFNSLQSMAWPTTILLPLLIVGTFVTYSIAKRVGVYREIHLVQLAYIAFLLLVPAYLTFKIIMLISKNGANYGIPSWMGLRSDWTIDTNYTIIVMTMTVIFAMILRGALIVFSILVMMNFKQGLRPIFLPESEELNNLLK